MYIFHLLLVVFLVLYVLVVGDDVFCFMVIWVLLVFVYMCVLLVVLNHFFSFLFSFCVYLILLFRVSLFYMYMALEAFCGYYLLFGKLWLITSQCRHCEIYVQGWGSDMPIGAYFHKRISTFVQFLLCFGDFCGFLAYFWYLMVWLLTFIYG